MRFGSYIPLSTLLFLLYFQLPAQKNPLPIRDSLSILAEDTLKENTVPTSRELIPKRALVYSLMLPGAGQVYNSRIWKVPLVYAGLGTGVFFIVYNRKQYVKYRDGYELMVKKEISSFEGITRKEGVKQARDYYRKYMETSYFITGAMYLLNGVEAYVDAHLKGFTIDEDLTLQIKIKGNNNFPVGVGLALEFH